LEWDPVLLEPPHFKAFSFRELRPLTDQPLCLWTLVAYPRLPL